MLKIISYKSNFKTTTPIRQNLCVCVSVGQVKCSAQDEFSCGSAQVTRLQDTYQPLIGQLGRHADEVS